MKKLILIGNLTKDVESKVVGSGKKLHVFDIAVNEKKGDQQVATYIRCNYWREDDKMNQYLKKGAKVHIIGNLDVQQYTNKDGQKATSVNCTVGELNILSWPSQGTQSTNQQSQQNNSAPTFNANVDDDLPF